MVPREQSRHSDIDVACWPLLSTAQRKIVNRQGLLFTGANLRIDVNVKQRGLHAAETSVHVKYRREKILSSNGGVKSSLDATVPEIVLIARCAREDCEGSNEIMTDIIMQRPE